MARIELKRLLEKTRKGAFRSMDVTRMAEAVKENKEHVIIGSIILYIVGYAAIGLGGLSFQSQTATGYVRVDDSSASSCVKGALWVNGDDLQWCATSNDVYEVRDETNDHIGTESPSSSVPGALWVEGVTLRYQDETGDTVYHIGGEEVDTGCSAAGAIWLENSPGIIHYCVADGSNDEFTVCNVDPDGLCPDG